MNNRQDVYHLSTNRKRSHWILWVGDFDDNGTFTWQHMPYAYGPKAGVPAIIAARDLLRAGWIGEVKKSGSPDHFHFVTSVGLLSQDELLELAETVWGEEAVRARKLAAEEREERELRELLSRADQGEPSALNKLAYRHSIGKGVRRSRQRAVELWSRAAAIGHARAQFNLAVCYRDGFGVRKDETKALKLYEDLASQGYYVGLKESAYCRRVGIGTKPDLKKALYWNFLLAKANGPEEFADGLVNCLAAGTGRTKLEREARQWLEQGAEKHIASRNMLRALEEDMDKSTPPARHAAGFGWISDDDDLLKLTLK